MSSYHTFECDGCGATDTSDGCNPNQSPRGWTQRDDQYGTSDYCPDCSKTDA